MTTIVSREVDGLAFRLQRRPGAGLPLLFLNGWGANLETLAPLVRALPGRDLVLLDMPGVGGSAIPVAPARIGRLVRAIAQLLHEERLERLHVAGYSYGGTLAQELVHRHPHVAASLTLIATTPGTLMVPSWPLISFAFLHPGWISNFFRPDGYFAPDFMTEVGPRLFGGRLRKEPRAIEPLLQNLHPPPLRGLLWQFLGVAGWTSLHWLHKLDLPALIIAGNDDPVINPLNAWLLKSRLRRAELHWVKNGGHLFPVLRPERYVPELQRFLARCD